MRLKVCNEIFQVRSILSCVVPIGLKSLSISKPDFKCEKATRNWEIIYFP